MTPTTQTVPSLTSLARGGGCGCKLDPGVLNDIIVPAANATMFPDLIVDAATRDDAAVYKLGPDSAIVATTDFFAPVVDDPFDFGRIAATNALSDVYAMGARPIFALALLGMPVGVLPADVIRGVLEGGRSVAEKAGAPVAGGHSIDAAEPFYGLVAMGLVHPDRVMTNAGARAGDVLILGKPLGIGVYSAALKRGILTADEEAEMIASTTLLNTPGPDIAAIEGVHAMTDVTGFGLLGHLCEMSLGAKLRADIRRDQLPVFEGARKHLNDGVRTGASGRNWAAIQHHVDRKDDWSQLDQDILTDPQTSGGLLVSCRPEAAQAVMDAFKAHGHAAACQIGEVTAGEPGVRVA